MAIVNAVILPNGRVLVATPALVTRGYRRALFDTGRGIEIGPDGRPAVELPPLGEAVTLPMAATPAAAAGPQAPPPPEELEVLTAPPPTEAEVSAALAGIARKDGLREYAIAQFGIELPVRLTDEQMRGRILALARSRATPDDHEDDSGGTAEGNAQ